MKPLIEQYSIVESSGNKYALKQSPDMQLKAELQTYKARQLFDLMKELQPERFQQMVTDKTIISFLNKIAAEFYKMIRQHLDNGLNEAEATEIEWPQLMQRAGLT